MSNKGLIRACENSGCGWKCCSFGSDGHIVILPHELDGHEKEISHLQIIDDDYFGGKKTANHVIMVTSLLCVKLILCG